MPCRWCHVCTFIVLFHLLQKVCYFILFANWILRLSWNMPSLKVAQEWCILWQKWLGLAPELPILSKGLFWAGVGTPPFSVTFNGAWDVPLQSHNTGRWELTCAEMVKYFLLFLWARCASLICESYSGGTGHSGSIWQAAALQHQADLAVSCWDSVAPIDKVGAIPWCCLILYMLAYI